MVMRDPTNENRHWRRDARVCGLADLFHHFGGQWAAKERFEYYEGLSIFAHKRERGKIAPERRASNKSALQGIWLLGPSEGEVVVTVSGSEAGPWRPAARSQASRDAWLPAQ